MPIALRAIFSLMVSSITPEYSPFSTSIPKKPPPLTTEVSTEMPTRLGGLNPKEISTYHKSRTSQRSILPDETNPYEMVIITDEEREPYFADFINWKNAQGIETGLFLTSDMGKTISGQAMGIDGHTEGLSNWLS